jgi:hypothetical protein
MDLRSEILKEHSKKQAMKIADWIGNDARKFALLVNLFLKDEYRVVQRAAWIVSIVADNHSELIVPHLATMMKRMQQQGLPIAVRRNVVRVLQNVNIPEKLHGAVMDACFGFLSDPKETIAVRCFSMTVLANMAKNYPEIKGELQTVIENVLQHKTSAGLRARAKNVNL